MCKSLSGLLHLTVCMFLFVAHVLASGLHSGWVRKRSELSGRQPTFALSLIFWPNTKDIATSASFFSLPPPSLLPLAPSSSFSCFWNGNPNVNFRFVVVVSFNRSSATPCTPVILFYNIYVTFYECLTQNTSLQKGHETTDLLTSDLPMVAECSVLFRKRDWAPGVPSDDFFTPLVPQLESRWTDRKDKDNLLFFPPVCQSKFSLWVTCRKHAMQDINVQS